jgi:hypothetical protein
MPPVGGVRKREIPNTLDLFSLSASFQRQRLLVPLVVFWRMDWVGFMLEESQDGHVSTKEQRSPNYLPTFPNAEGPPFSTAGIFIVEGLLTIVIAIAAYFLIPTWPSKTKFLTAREKAIVEHRLQDDSDAYETEGFQWSEVIRAIKSWQIYGYCMLFHGFAFALYTLSLFLP